MVDRRSERGAIEHLVGDVIAGRSRVAVLRGEAGVGKSALLEYVTELSDGCRVARAAGVEAEMELAYSGLHQLCAPLMHHNEKLHPPQRSALMTVFGMQAGPAPEPFLVGVATLSLLAEAAEVEPLICIIDDAQWLDHASAQVFGFVGRRLVAERVAMVCAARTGERGDSLDGLPEWHIDGLPERDARELLKRHVPGSIDAKVFARIVAECRGNPLALIELPRTWDGASLAAGFGLPGTAPVATSIEMSYVRRLKQLPTDTQVLMLTAAAEPLGDLGLLDRAVQSLGLELGHARPALDAGLLHIDTHVAFAHPLVRSAVYRSATATDRHRVHVALAGATDVMADPDRRAWHLANATLGPDEDVALELERSATRARERGGAVAAAAFLQRALTLTVDSEHRTKRALDAAEASLHAGSFQSARESLDTAESGSPDSLQQARIELLRANIAFTSGVGREAPPLLLRAAQRLEPIDPGLARDTYMNAWAAANFAGLPARNELLVISEAIRGLPARANPKPALDLMLEGLALIVTEGHAAAAATLHRAAAALTQLPPEEVLRWGWHAAAASDATWNNDASRAIAERNSKILRDAGALAHLPFPLTGLANAAMRSGDFSGAALHCAEAEAIAAATGSRFAPYTRMRLLALQGRENETRALIATTLQSATAEGQGLAAQVAHWATAILCNGLGRYAEAAEGARQCLHQAAGPFVSSWVLPELIEAAVRSGDEPIATEGLERLERITQACATDWALGVESRCRALLVESDPQELYKESIARLDRSRLQPELARSHLTYGEWLRRAGLRTAAREHLQLADDICTTIGMGAFAERARRELVAMGLKVRRRRDNTRSELTPQEEQIARLARDGHSNPEIGAMLFLSPRTVEWHLSHVFAKLGIGSRNALHSALPKAAGESGLGGTDP